MFLRTISFVLIVMFSAAVGSVWASDKQKAEVVRSVVSQNVQELLVKFEQERQYYDTDPSRFFGNMDTALSKIVDFRRIAARVMGKYAKRASKDQRDRFVEVFKQSLYQTYTKTLVESGEFTIKVTKAALNSRSDKRASVDLEVLSDSGNVYPVIYSMYQNKQDEWLMENVIVFGINIGLAFRDRFESQMRAHKGDIDRVIESWSVELDIQQPKKG